VAHNHPGLEPVGHGAASLNANQLEVGLGILSRHAIFGISHGSRSRLRGATDRLAGVHDETAHSVSALSTIRGGDHPGNRDTDTPCSCNSLSYISDTRLGQPLCYL
jgi:hypothetical protein